MSRLHSMLRVLRGDINHLPRVIIFTIASTSVYMIGWGFADPFMTVYLAGFSNDYALVGWLQTLMMAVAFIMLVPVGDLLDRVNHQRLMIAAKIGYTIVGIAYFAAGEFDSVPFLIFARVLNGMLIPLVWASAASTIRDYSTKKNASLAYGLYLTTRQLAFSLGLGVALWVVWQFPIHYIFIPVIIFPPLSILLQRNLPDKHDEPFFHALKEIIFTDKLVLRFFKEMKQFNKEMWAMYVLLFCMAAIDMIGTTYISLYAIERGFSFVKVGLLMLTMTLPYFLSFLSAELADRTERLRNIIIGLAISAAALLGFAFVGEHDWLLFFIGFVYVSGYAVALPSAGSIVTVLTPKGYNGASTALVDMTLFLAVVVFAPIAGMLIDAGGFGLMFKTAAIFLAVVMIWATWLRHRFRKKNVAYHKAHPHAKHNPYII